MKQNGVIRDDEGVEIVYLKTEELESESFISKARSRSRLYWKRGVGVRVGVALFEISM